MRRTRFLKYILGLFALKTVRTQTLPPAAVQFQKLLNAPVCPLCKTSVESKPAFMAVLNDTGDSLNGDTLLWPILVCPKDGVVFCVQNIPG